MLFVQQRTGQYNNRIELTTLTTSIHHIYTIMSSHILV